jgi:hypothetical protein
VNRGHLWGSESALARFVDYDLQVCEKGGRRGAVARRGGILAGSIAPSPGSFAVQLQELKKSARVSDYLPRLEPVRYDPMTWYILDELQMNDGVPMLWEDLQAMVQQHKGAEIVYLKIDEGLRAYSVEDGERFTSIDRAT